MKITISIALFIFAGLPISMAAEKFEPLFVREILPDGWIKNQMFRDMNQGFAGKLDQLTSKANEKMFHDPDSNNVYGGDYVNWGPAEAEGNWMNGLISMAYTCNHSQMKAKVDDYIAGILDGQEDDGYIGIFPANIRWQQCGVDNNNGELWAQACILRALLNYYECTDDETVLTAVKNAVDAIRSNYYHGRGYFTNDDGSFGGPSHGLSIIDVFERLYQITGESVYGDYALWLYNDYNAAEGIRDTDVKKSNLENLSLNLSGHAVHVAEHLRVIPFLYHTLGRSGYDVASANAFKKLKRHMSISGALIGDESVNGREPKSTISCEYCTITETMDTLLSYLQKDGKREYGDLAELCIYNAAQGARLPNGDAISYLAPDQRLDATDEKAGGRYKLSPTHEDIAVCCNPNAVRIMPRFVSRMWMRKTGDNAGFVAACLGPSKLRSEHNGQAIHIDAVTSYPFSRTVRFNIEPQGSTTSFALWVRIPGWSTGATFEQPQGTQREIVDGYYVFTNTWESGDSVAVDFEASLDIKEHVADEYFIQWGPLVYAIDLMWERSVIKDYPVAGFHDYSYALVDGQTYDYGFNENVSFSIVANQNGDWNFPWFDPPRKINTWLKNGDNQWEAQTLWPLGSTVLRAVKLSWR